MQVQVNQAQVLALSQIRRNHPKLDGAISADHNRNVPLAHGFRQMRLGFPDAGSDCLPVLREQIRSIGTPSPHRKIAVIDDRQTFLAKHSRKARVPEGLGGLLLSRAVRP